MIAVEYFRDKLDHSAATYTMFLLINITINVSVQNVVTPKPKPH